RRWKEKFSTLFPDSMTRHQVIEAVLHAWKHRNTGSKTKWEGPAGTGFTIQGYLNRRGNINTAYPIYTKK
ncbi:MAG: EndoU domain-containing protein, partial [Thermodesulfobacteriota bacterium]|nr:EndoU domain-containing protein [Thermodesulfobacteriota bacterium]